MVTIIIALILLYIVIGIFILTAQIDYMKKEDPETLELLYIGPPLDLIKFCLYSIIMWLPSLIEFTNEEDEDNG
jgi:hypothetical protein